MVNKGKEWKKLKPQRPKRPRAAFWRFVDQYKIMIRNEENAGENTAVSTNLKADEMAVASTDLKADEKVVASTDEGAGEEADQESGEEASEEANEEAGKEANEEAGKEANEEAGKEADEEADEEANEESDEEDGEEANEESDEEDGEEDDEEADDEANEESDEEDGEEANEESDEEDDEEDDEEADEEADKRSKAKALFSDAVKMWNALTVMEKAMYEDRDQLEAYKVKMQEYNKKKEAMKNPPTAYALYTRQYWKIHDLTCNGDPDEFGRIKKRVAKDWNKLNEAEKEVYKASANLLKALFEREKAAVLARKRPFNEEWHNEGLKNLESALYKRPGGKQVKKDEENEKSEQEKDQYEENVQQERNDGSESNMDMETDDELDNSFDYSMEED